MTTNHHTPHPFGFPLTAAALEAPHGELDAAIASVIATGSGTATTLTATAASGQATLVVASSAGFAPGDPIYLKAAAGLIFESRIVNTVPNGTTITVTVNLTNAYDPNSTVSKSPIEIVDARSGALTLKARLDDVNGGRYNVKAFGAKGDGAANDTSAIQAAIDAAEAAGGGLVFFPSGTYNHTLITVEASGVALEGAGYSSRLVFTGASGPALRLGTKTSGVAITDLAIDRLRISGNASADYGIHAIGVQFSRFGFLRIDGFTKSGAIGLCLDTQSTGSFVACTNDVFWALYITGCYHGLKLTKDAADSGTDGCNHNTFFGPRIASFSGIGCNVDAGEFNCFYGLDSSTNANTTTGLRINDDVCVFIGVRTDNSFGGGNNAIGIDITANGRDHIVLMPTGDGPTTRIQKASDVTGFILREGFSEWIGSYKRSSFSHLTEGRTTRTMKNISASNIVATEVCYTDSTVGEGEVKRSATGVAPAPWPQVAVTQLNLSGGLGEVALPGSIVPVLCDTAAVAVGDTLVTSAATNGQAKTDNAQANRRFILGYARTSKAGGSAGTVKAWII